MKYFSFVIMALALCFLCSVQAQCPSVCPAVFQPTCGFNGRCYRQFGNGCEMGVENCKNKQKFTPVGLENCRRNGTPKC